MVSTEYDRLILLSKSKDVYVTFGMFSVPMTLISLKNTLIIILEENIDYRFL